MTKFVGRFQNIQRFAVLTLPLLLVAVMLAEDWPQFRGPNRYGVWNATGIMESFPPDGLKISWRVPVGRGLSSPVVAQGRVFLTDVQLQQPEATERVVCFDEVNGKQLWSHQYAVNCPEWAFDPQHGGGPRATPIIRDGRLFTLGALGNLFCLDAGLCQPSHLCPQRRGTGLRFPGREAMSTTMSEMKIGESEIHAARAKRSNDPPPG